MSPLRRIFTSAASDFKKLDPVSKRKVTTVVYLANSAQHHVSENFLPIALASAESAGVSKSALSKAVHKAVVIEMQLALMRSCRIEHNQNLEHWWGGDPDVLREVIATLILSESGDERNTLVQCGYSPNPDEARAQVLLKMSKLIGTGGDKWVEQMSGNPAFLEFWRKFTTAFVSGSLLAPARDEAGFLAHMPNKFRDLPRQQETLVRYFMHQIV